MAEEFWSVFNKTKRADFDAKGDIIEVDETTLEGDEDGERGDYVRKGIAELKVSVDPRQPGSWIKLTFS